jgi:hypothetical protein
MANKPLDCKEKPSLPQEVLAKADIDVLSHSDLLQSINSHLNTNSINPNVSASTTLSKPANVGDLKLEIVDTRYYLLIYHYKLFSTNNLLLCSQFSIGMHVMIGTGASVEIRTVTGLGSIILDTSVNHNHAIGTLIRGFVSFDDMNEIMKEEDIHVSIQNQLDPFSDIQLV